MSAHVVTVNVYHEGATRRIKCAVDFDPNSAAHSLAGKALNNKSRVAKRCKGAVSVEVLSIDGVGTLAGTLANAVRS